jgi:hypothetical protein
MSAPTLDLLGDRQTGQDVRTQNGTCYVLNEDLSQKFSPAFESRVEKAMSLRRNRLRNAAHYPLCSARSWGFEVISSLGECPGHVTG